jgi:hypothetical protein
MGSLQLSVALIRKIDDQVRWLGKISNSRKQIDFVTAQRLESESWRETITREVAWELDLDRKRDFIVSNMAQLNVEFSAMLPGHEEPTQIACAFYNVELYRKSVLQQIESKEGFIWLTSGEICDGISEIGIPLNPMIVILNEQANVIQRWESDATGDYQ